MTLATVLLGLATVPGNTTRRISCQWAPASSYGPRSTAHLACPRGGSQMVELQALDREESALERKMRIAWVGDGPRAPRGGNLNHYNSTDNIGATDDVDCPGSGTGREVATHVVDEGVSRSSGRRME